MRGGAKLDGPAFSYIRFSAKEQERGDSLRRQTEMRDAWLARNPGVVLDGSLTLRDLGVSAFRGRNREGDANGLGQFLKLVEAGRIPKNALLIVENLDRLSREDELTATHLITGLLLAGVRIVQLEPEAVFDRSADQMQVMRMVLEIGRAHAESARKSVRVGEAWDARKARARAGEGAITARCPAWLELVNGKFKVRAGAGAVLKRVYRLSAAGYGCRLIVATFNREKVPAWGKGK
jgi:DNA invertase Pin-like site-specific DNA recombinase